MTTSNNSAILQDVVAYVDVWSSDKTANYSKPFVQQLQEMGAQVSKTFNKRVTHVVFGNGHPATWRRAKKSDVKLVSVLWVGRCYDDGVRVDEELYPALNDESNPVLQRKRHRCMQPKDSPVRTPENDWRMRKKLDKMMKEHAPKQLFVPDVSPIIIDQENGIIYSPSLKRSDYMAERLKDMKEKRENLSPTASQMLESCSPTELKPSLGSTPTVFKFMYEQSDEDSSISVAEPGYSHDEEGRTQDVSDHENLEKCRRKGSKKPLMLPCHDVPKQVSSPLKCPDFSDKEDEEEERQKKSRRTSINEKPADEHKFEGLLENPCQDWTSDSRKKFHKEMRQSQLKSSSSSRNTSEKGKQKFKSTKSFTDTKTNICPDAVKSPTSIFLPGVSVDPTVELSEESAAAFLKTPKQGRPSLSALVQAFNPSGKSASVATCSAVEDDGVFEDYFSPASHHKRPLLPNLCMERDTEFPFELDPAPKKRKQRRESFGLSSKKKSKLRESSSGKNCNQRSDGCSQPQSHPQLDVKEPLLVLDSPRANETPMAKKRRQSTLSFASTSTPASDVVKQRRASTSEQPQMVTKAVTVSELQKKSDISVPSHTLESRGNECTVAAGLSELPSDVESDRSKEVELSPQKMVNKTKAKRTLVMTSMPTEKQHLVGQVVKALGGFSIVDQVCESTTHVVSGSHRRTLNILLGIARGCWILSFEWIMWCLEQRQWIPEEPYELSDQFPAAQICRLQRHLSAGEHQQDLFQDQPAMFVSQHSQPPTQSLVELIQLCGGTVCKTVRQAGICIGKYNGRRPVGSKILSEQWVLDSITHLKQLPYDNYNLE
ncbi:microcephalin isoform X1 [Mastacembelus armatus]|uniref:Microcephalin 1 n=1 Tax=Mastacembelus armatus TaxID=205130 RepID=A0A3Q3RRG1_9TELE|nr:microcephalin isoform X1 [Mastacembelus armatus]XP_026164670.1 microcephalin isoform X1 [Mastacembelus armatus]